MSTNAPRSNEGKRRLADLYKNLPGPPPTMHKNILHGTEAFEANLRHAARNHEKVSIGGGVFSDQELVEAADALHAERTMREVLTNVWNRWDKNDDADAPALGAQLRAALGIQ